MAVSKSEKKPKAPAHLADATRKWFRSVVTEFRLEPHHVRLLTLTCECWDRCTQAREAIAKDGAYLPDRFGQLRAHPGIAVERDAKISFARLIRELDLDVEPPAASPAPPLLKRYGTRSL